MIDIPVRGSIRLDQFLKWSNAAGSGGQGKLLIQSGRVSVNGSQTFARGKNLSPGDIVAVDGIGTFRVTLVGEGT